MLNKKVDEQSLEIKNLKKIIENNVNGQKESMIKCGNNINSNELELRLEIDNMRKNLNEFKKSNIELKKANAILEAENEDIKNAQAEMIEEFTKQ